MINRIFDWVSATALWIWILKNIISKFTFRLSEYPKFEMDQFWEIIRILEKSETEAPGLALYAFTETDYESMSGKFVRASLKQKMSHAGIIIPGPTADLCKILHMKSGGCYYDSLLNLLKEVDVFGVHRFNVPADKAELFSKRLWFLIENRHMLVYDFQGNLETTLDWSEIDGPLLRGHSVTLKKKTPIYCSELIRIILKGIVDLPTENEFDRQVFPPDAVRAYQHAELFMFDPPRKKHGLLRSLLTALVLPVLLLASLLR